MNKRLLIMNAPEYALESISYILPSLKELTISKLYKKEGWCAVQSIVPEDQVIKLIPKLIEKGATDILETEIIKVV